MGLFQIGDFTLNSGTKSNYKIECDALDDDDWNCLALLLKERTEPFSDVYGIPRGGLKLEQILKPFATGQFYEHGILIVDDVYTTGGSFERFKKELLAPLPWNYPDPQGAVVFARSPVKSWIVPLFRMYE
jgi:orotate phosphoribosyltransferase